MAEFILEIFSEEIPARMQLKAADDLKKHLSAALMEKGLPFSSLQTYVTPRRLVAVVEGLIAKSEEKKEEKRGPRLTAPDKAIEGFLKSIGLSSLESCEKRDGYYYASVTTPPQETVSVLPDIIRQIFRQFSWPKSMRWPGALIPWVRPVRSIVTVFDQKPVVFQVEEVGITTGAVTYGHRHLKPAPIVVTTFSQYQADLKAAFIVLDHAHRQELILSSLNRLGSEQGYSLEIDQGLLEEVAGLIEYPVVHLGRIDDQYRALPKAVLSTSMRVHQKYFSFVTEKGQLAPIFGFVSNTIPSDDGQLLLEGYERVLRARLSDAQFFYKQDLKTSLVSLLPKLDKIVFHAKLGTVGQKSDRLRKSVDSEAAQRAALLCKTDLVTSMVGEFPELQGFMGRCYAQAQGESPLVAQAIQEHYQPQGPQDDCPQESASIDLALADKIDTLVGFFGMGESPTGSKDPYALRRAALGVIRLIRQNNLSQLDLTQLIHRSLALYAEQGTIFDQEQTTQQLTQFILERLEHALRGEEIRYDCIKAVLATYKPSTPLNIWSLAQRTIALHSFLESEAGNSLQDAFRRANGILVKETDKGEAVSINPDLFSSLYESALHQQLLELRQKSQILLEAHHYSTLMDELSGLKGPVDDFFTLKINDDDEAIRSNRLGLLRYLISQTADIADFSQLEK